MMENNKVILDVKDLRQHFRVGSGKRRINVKAVDGISFQVHEGEVFGLVGESGCGKTTTGRTIIKLYKPTDGIVEYNGKIIGAGFSGNLRRISILKSDAKLAIIKEDEYKYKRYTLNEEYKKLINNEKTILSKLKSKFIEDKKDVNYFNENIKTEKLVAKSQFKLEVSELKHDKVKEIDLLKLSPEKKNDHNYKMTIEAAKKRFNLKASYLPESLLSKEERVEQYNIFKKEYYMELILIENQYLRRLFRYNQHKYLTVANKLYNFRLNKPELFNNEIISEAEEKLSDLKTIIPEAHIEIDKDSIKREISEIEKNYRNEVSLLETNYKNIIEKLNSQFKSSEELKPKFDKIHADYTSQSEKVKTKITSLKLELKSKLNDLKENKKSNPDLFKVDKEKQQEIKAKLKVEVKKEKEEISKLKKLNKISETEEERAIRIDTVNKLTEIYNNKKTDYLNKINTLKSEMVENDNATLTKKLEELELDFKRYEIEAKLEIKKAEIKNSYAGVMSQLQMIFQDPVSSLNPRKTVKEIISEGLIIQGIKDKDYISEKVAESLKLVGLAPEHASRYPHEFSGGQRQRIGIARALIVNPKFIIADEPISALDVSIQAQIINLLKDLKEELGLTILFIAHDLSVVKYFSNRIAVMYFGKIVEQATAEQLFANPLHPYTKSLLSAIPQPDPLSEQTRVREPYDPSIHNYSVDKPEMIEITQGHFIYANKAEVSKYKKELEEKGAK